MKCYISAVNTFIISWEILLPCLSDCEFPFSGDCYQFWITSTWGLTWSMKLSVRTCWKGWKHYAYHVCMYVCMYVCICNIYMSVCVCNLALVLIIIAFDLPSLCYFIYRYIRWILSLSACIELCIKPGISSWLAGIETFVHKSCLKKWLRSVFIRFYHVFIRFVLSTFLWQYKPT